MASPQKLSENKELVRARTIKSRTKVVYLPLVDKSTILSSHHTSSNGTEEREQ